MNGTPPFTGRAVLLPTAMRAKSNYFAFNFFDETFTLDTAVAASCADRRKFFDVFIVKGLPFHLGNLLAALFANAFWALAAKLASARLAIPSVFEFFFTLITDRMGFRQALFVSAFSEFFHAELLSNGVGWNRRDNT